MEKEIGYLEISMGLVQHEHGANVVIYLDEKGLHIDAYTGDFWLDGREYTYEALQKKIEEFKTDVKDSQSDDT